MISKSVKWLATACLVMAASVAAALPQLTGQLDFSGNASFVQSGNTVSQVTFNAARVEFGTGDFASLMFNTQVNFLNPWDVTSTPTPFTLWTIDLGGFSFTLENLTVNKVDGTHAALRGTGYISADGFADTAGYWHLTTQGANNPVFSFSSSTQPVPEPATLALLGAGLAGLGLARRRAA